MEADEKENISQYCFFLTEKSLWKHAIFIVLVCLDVLDKVYSFVLILKVFSPSSSSEIKLKRYKQRACKQSKVIAMRCFWVALGLCFQIMVSAETWAAKYFTFSAWDTFFEHGIFVFVNNDQ